MITKKKNLENLKNRAVSNNERHSVSGGYFWNGSFTDTHGFPQTSSSSTTPSNVPYSSVGRAVDIYTVN